MTDWTRGMEQTYEFWLVNRDSWSDTEQLRSVVSATVVRDANEETLGHAMLEMSDMIGEEYVRIYLVADGKRECLGTFLVQTPGSSFDGKAETVSVDCYTPLLELSSDMPPFGYYISAESNIADTIYNIVCAHAHAPMIYAPDAKVLYEPFVADPTETWLSFASALASRLNSEIALDALGRIYLSPLRDTPSMQPTYTFTDDNSSILLPDISDDNDLYGIPNVCEVIYSTKNSVIIGRAVNDDPSSPISTVSRGRKVLYRETNPQIENPTQETVDAYALQSLRNRSVREHIITFSHGYCGVKLGDCVRLRYRRAGLDAKARITSQSIECSTGCIVTATAIYTEAMWA